MTVHPHVNHLTLNKTVLKMLEMYRGVQLAEPPLDPDADAYSRQEQEMNHYEWQRHLNSIRLMTSIQLFNMALNQLYGPDVRTDNNDR